MLTAVGAALVSFQLNTLSELVVLCATKKALVPIFCATRKLAFVVETALDADNIPAVKLENFILTTADAFHVLPAKQLVVM